MPDNTVVTNPTIRYLPTWALVSASVGSYWRVEFFLENTMDSTVGTWQRVIYASAKIWWEAGHVSAVLQSALGHAKIRVDTLEQEASTAGNSTHNHIPKKQHKKLDKRTSPNAIASSAKGRLRGDVILGVIN